MIRKDPGLISKAAAAIILLAGIMASSAVVSLPSQGVLWRAAAILPLAAFLSFYMVGYLKGDRPTYLRRLFFGLLSLLLLKSVQLYFLAQIPQRPLFDILLLSVFTVAHPLSNAAVYAATLSILNLSNDFHVWGQEVYRLTAMFETASLFAIIFIAGIPLRKERAVRRAAEEAFKSINSFAERISDESADDQSISISKAGKDHVFISAASEFAVSITKVLEDIRSFTNANSCCLFSITGDTYRLYAHSAGDNDLLREVPKNIGKCVLSWIEDNSRPLLLNNVSDRSVLGYYRSRTAAKHFLGVPVFSRTGDLAGILSIDRNDPPFSKEDERTLTVAASAIAVSIDNASVMSRMRMEAREFSGFYTIVKKLTTTLKSEDILDTAIDLSRGIVDYDLAGIALRGKDGSLRFVAAKGETAPRLLNSAPPGEMEFFEWIISKGTAFQFYKSRMEKMWPGRLPGPVEKMGSYLCVPLVSRNDTLGIFMTARMKDIQYSRYEVKLLEAMAAHVSVAVSNSMIYRQMEEMATRDGMTGLYNFRYFRDRLSHEVERAERYRQQLALLLVDIDHFKKVNDTWGHPAGDAVLKSVAGILAGSVREVDLAARYGGEEFAVILINADARHTLQVAERIRKSIEKTSVAAADNKNINVTASIGISLFPADADNQRLLTSRADAALYLAKKEGRNRVYCYRDVEARELSKSASA